ncbi:hypothetical protein AAHE18_15G245700 [Arachis hypogaea]
MRSYCHNFGEHIENSPNKELTISKKHSTKAPIADAKVSATTLGDELVDLFSYQTNLPLFGNSLGTLTHATYQVSIQEQRVPDKHRKPITQHSKATHILKIKIKKKKIKRARVVSTHVSVTNGMCKSNFYGKQHTS